MAYTPSTAINSSRDFRNQYLRKSLSNWLNKLKARHQGRQELAKPVALRVAELDPSVNQTETMDHVRSEQSFGVHTSDYQAALPRNAA